MLLDIGKESSDAFPPLKSCLGGINALIKHYEVGLRDTGLGLTDEYEQQYNDVKDKLDDLIPWVKKLLVSLAKARTPMTTAMKSRDDQSLQSLYRV